MDDEQYFALSNAEIKGNDGFYMDNIEKCSNNLKSKERAKLPHKVLVWCTISTRGDIQILCGSSKEGSCRF